MSEEIDYKALLSADVANFFRSPVRDIFKRVDLSKIYSFAGGYPSADTFPLDQISATVDAVIAKYGAKALQYGATQGAMELREVVAKRCGVNVESVQITTSSQQGIDVITRVLVNPGDGILTACPTYLGALQSFASYRAVVRGVECEATGESTYSAYKQAVAQFRKDGITPKFIYSIPDFQNPSGETLTLAQREALVRVAREEGILIVEDAPYRELRYEGTPLPTIYSLGSDCTVHLGSFSKIFAPGFRLGWMFAPETVLDSVYVCKQSLDLCPPVLDQYVAAEFMGSGKLDINLQNTLKIYKRKRDLLLSLLEKHMPEGVTWTHPEGGLFLFLTLPEGFDSVKFYDVSLDRGVAYVAGCFFYPDGSHRNTMRMNFSFMTEEKIAAGVPLLAELIREEIGKL